MTIFFSGQEYKYEIEGICKLFFPLKRFKHSFEGLKNISADEYIITRLKLHKKTTLLWVMICINEKTYRLHKIINNDIDDYKNECERELCILLYHILSSLTNITPMWGILTGVRPVSLIQKKRRENKSDEEIKRYFKEKYLVSEQKLDLAFKTANTQEKILKDFLNNSYSLYVSIPFCVSRCSYCSFVSHAIDRPKATDKIDEYIELLCIELQKTSELAEELKLKLDTIYIGGGTPTALLAPQLKRVTDTISKYFDVKNVREYTIEAGRADTITKEKLIVIKNSGADRISVNPQTFNDNVLKAVGRNHTALQAEECFLLARELGFENINMDFIAGLPTDSLESFKRTIDKAIELSPSNITLHTLSIKRSAELFDVGIEVDIKNSMENNLTAQMTEYSKEKLINAGYMPYYLYRQKNTIGNLENVGYAKDGFESLYNVYIMEEMQTILSCGAGGVTKLVKSGENADKKRLERVFNYKYHFEYISGFDEILRRKEKIRDYFQGIE